MCERKTNSTIPVKSPKRQRKQQYISMIVFRYNFGYTANMKTAISIPDTIFQQAEKTARQLKITRSELYAKAVVAFVEQHHTQGVTEKLNEIYAAENSKLEPGFTLAQTAMLNAEDW